MVEEGDIGWLRLPANGGTHCINPRDFNCECQIRRVVCSNTLDVVMLHNHHGWFITPEMFEPDRQNPW